MGASQQYKNKMMGDHGSDAFARLNSEKRTGYQTGSDQPVDFSQSAADMRSGEMVSDENFDAVSANVFGSMRSPITVQRENLESNSQENLTRLVNYTRQQHCAQTMLDYEKQKTNNFQSTYARSPKSSLQVHHLGQNTENSKLHSYENNLIVTSQRSEETKNSVQNNKQRSAIHVIDIESSPISRAKEINTDLKMYPEQFNS